MKKRKQKLFSSFRKSLLLLKWSISMKKNIVIFFLFTVISVLSFADDFILVEGGTFSMGSSQNWDGGEIPVHSVTVNSFYMSKHEVTFEQYDRFCNETDRSKPDDEGWGRGNRPVINVSWYDAVEYCNWLSEIEGLQKAYTIDKNTTDPNNENISSYDDKKWLVMCNFGANGYRLPTEAEWEFSARGGNNSRGYRYSGSNKPSEVAWWKRDSGTQPVGQKNPNELGLYDMTGNVLEMCWDWLVNDYYSYSPPRNPRGPSSGTGRVQRGGCWDHPLGGYIRWAQRDGIAPCNSNNFSGFRPVRTEIPFAAASQTLDIELKTTVASQDLGIEFRTIEEELEIAAVAAIFQDSRGFMWFGTQMELTRFDGFDYKTYMNVPFDENSLSGNAVYSLLEDSFGNFWVGTAEDLCLFNREREVFIHYVHKPEDPSSIPAGRVFSLFEDKTMLTKRRSAQQALIPPYDERSTPPDVLWIGTDSGFCVYDREKDAFELVLPDPGTVSDFYADNYPVYVDISGTKWLGTSQGLYKLTSRDDYQFEHFAHDPKDPSSLGTNEVTSITGDQSGNLWIGTWGDGVNKLDTRTMIFSSIISDPEYLDGIDTTNITSLITDADGS
ncbi:MAG: SUMF1/EgtB/PvdO family nonheme iron enzyme, partial [Spirochaetales bacterium]|nr:SUMF1/EgtB/PvdO family nonheme iron enzyme [Spirochaetales bacterium]